MPVSILVFFGAIRVEGKVCDYWFSPPLLALVLFKLTVSEGSGVLLCCRGVG